LTTQKYLSILGPFYHGGWVLVFIGKLVFFVESLGVVAKVISMLLFALQLSSKTNSSWSLG